MPRKFFRKYLPSHESVRQNRYIRFFGTALHHPNLWHLNRKSVAGTVAAFLASLTLCLWVVQSQGLPLPWVALAVVISVSNTLLELLSPRGTDDFTMATANALVCWGFGAWVL